MRREWVPRYLTRGALDHSASSPVCLPQATLVPADLNPPLPPAVCGRTTKPPCFARSVQSIHHPSLPPAGVEKTRPPAGLVSRTAISSVTPAPTPPSPPQQRTAPLESPVAPIFDPLFLRRALVALVDGNGDQRTTHDQTDTSARGTPETSVRSHSRLAPCPSRPE